MKKWLTILFFVPALVLGENIFDFENWAPDKWLVWQNGVKLGNSADSSFTEGKRPTFLGKLSMDNVCFDLQVRTRGTNDSLLVTIQTTQNPVDTNTWQTLTTFDGVKAATGHTIRCFPTGTLARDSTLPLFQYVRIFQGHSIDAPGAGDTSSFYLFIRQKGLRRY